MLSEAQMYKALVAKDFLQAYMQGKEAEEGKCWVLQNNKGGYPARLSSLQSVQSAGIAESDSGIHQITLARVGLRSFSEV